MAGSSFGNLATDLAGLPTNGSTGRPNGSRLRRL